MQRVLKQLKEAIDEEKMTLSDEAFIEPLDLMDAVEFIHFDAGSSQPVS